MLSHKQQIIKRVFDLIFSLFGLVIFMIPILILIFIATFSTRQFGLFSQKRVGKHAKIFKIFKIRTMKYLEDENFITLKDDPRLTNVGKIFRKYHLDELPQLFNVLIGDMGFVGPRPDVAGYADLLQGEDRIILSVRPGITGPATLKFKNEDILLSQQTDPKKYNDTVIWKEKVRINKEYIMNWTLLGDINFIFKTIFT
jgi:lipopolysaccharide/colanic/teichoic acid biosynthesis glycosyltransferase